MKHNFYIFLFLLCLTSIKGFSQTGADSLQNDRISRGLFIFIKNNLQMTEDEAKKSEPIVNQYIVDMRKVQVEYKDPLERQQQKATVRVNYRNQLSPVLGQVRANKVFVEEARFRNEVRKLIQERKNQQKKRRKSI
jgi:hypothetical protein